VLLNLELFDFEVYNAAPQAAIPAAVSASSTVRERRSSALGLDEWSEPATLVAGERARKSEG
jgi:hypothetical protein